MSDDGANPPNAGQAAGEQAIRDRMAGARPEDPNAAGTAAVAEAFAGALEKAVAKLGAQKADGRRRKRQECNAVAEAILSETRLTQDRAGTMFIYNGRHWEEATDHLLRHMAKVADGEDTTRDRRGEIVDYLKTSVHNRDLVWGRSGDHEIPFANGVLDVLSGGLRDHTPDDYLENVVPWDWQPGRESPLWRATLDTWFPPDADADGRERQEVVALQEFFGYVLLPHSRFKKALVLYGESDTGKSVVPAVMRAMVGERFCCTLGVDQMDDPILRAVLVGKRLNTVTEISESAMVSDGGFKTLVSTEEAILVNEKYKPAYEYKPHAKHVFATNNLPRVSDRTKAVFNRLLLVLFRIVIEKQDRDLVDKLTAEMAGILCWSVDGARRLIDRHGQFSEPSESREEVQRYMAEMNPFIAFGEECLSAGGGGVLLGSLVDRFNSWNRGSRKATMRQVTRMARQAGYDIRSMRLGDAGGRSVKALVGHDLRAATADTELRDDGPPGPEPPPPDL